MTGDNLFVVLGWACVFWWLVFRPMLRDWKRSGEVTRRIKEGRLAEHEVEHQGQNPAYAVADDLSRPLLEVVEAAEQVVVDEDRRAGYRDQARWERRVEVRHGVVIDSMVQVPDEAPDLANRMVSRVVNDVPSPSAARDGVLHACDCCQEYQDANRWLVKQLGRERARRRAAS